MNQKKANAALFEEKIMNLLGKQLKGFSGAGRSTGALVGAGGGALAGLGGTALGQLAGNDSETNASGKMDSYLKNALRGAAVGAGAGGIAGANMGASRLRNFVRKGVSNAAPRLEEKMLANPAALEELKSHIMSQPGLYQAGEGAGMIENMFQKKLQANRSREMIDELRRAKAQASVKPKKPVVENMENMGQRGNVPKNTKKTKKHKEPPVETTEKPPVSEINAEMVPYTGRIPKNTRNVTPTKLDMLAQMAGKTTRKAKDFAVVTKNKAMAGVGKAREAAKEFRKGFDVQKKAPPSASEASVRGSSVFDEPSFMRKAAPEAKTAPKPENPSKSFEELVKERQMPSMVDAAAAKIKKPSAEPSANILRGAQKSPEDMKKSFMSSVKKEKTPEQVQKEQKTQQAQEKQEQRAQRMDSEETGRNQTIDDIRKVYIAELDKAKQKGDSLGMIKILKDLQSTYRINKSV